MATLWITYAWADNESGDVDYIAQELEAAGLTIKLDRWNIGAGKRLWEQIENFIQNPDECDAWLIVATQNSLGSEACREEYNYALDSAINKRGSDFPLIGLFPSKVEDSLIPAGIRTRLYVSMTDPDWKERVVAAAEKRSINIDRSHLKPYQVKISFPSTGGFVIELRPRAGSWSPFVVAIPASEREAVQMDLFCGAANRPPVGGYNVFLTGYNEGIDGDWFAMTAANEATPTMSYYLICKALPSKISFGVNGGIIYTVIRPERGLVSFEYKEQ